MNLRCPRCGAVATVELKGQGRYGIGGDTRVDTACLELKERPEAKGVGARRACTALIGEVERIAAKRR